MSIKYNRFRFYTSGTDYRPIVWPIPGPYWCSGESFAGDRFVLIAYLPIGGEITKYWPEAYDIELLEENTDIKYTSRFPRVKWMEEQGL